MIYENYSWKFSDAEKEKLKEMRLTEQFIRFHEKRINNSFLPALSSNIFRIYDKDLINETTKIGCKYIRNIKEKLMKKKNSNKDLH